MTDNTQTDSSNVGDSGITIFDYDGDEQTTQAIDRGGTRHPDGFMEDIYSPKYDIEVGETVVADQDNGSQQTMWRAEVVWTADDEDTTEEQYLAEHPAEAILGAVEKSCGGEL